MPRSGLQTNKIPNQANELSKLIQQALSVAKTLMDEDDPNLVEIATKSSDRTHKIAVCFYCGLKLHVCECLFILMQDSDPLVIHAAEIACEEIANKKYKQIATAGQTHVNFGPFMLGPGENLDKIRSENPEQLAERCKSAADLWQEFFKKKEAKLKLYQEKGKHSDTKKNKGV